MKLALFALTGFGNSVLKALLDAKLDVCLLATRRESGPYPYYPERDLAEYAQSCGVKYSYDMPSADDLRSMDVVLTATYHRILPIELIASVKWALNLHPSLLPRYRGASPLFWALRNGESEVGLTLHALSKEPDKGDIFAQQRVLIRSWENQGELRARLAGLAGNFVASSLAEIVRGGVKPRPQDESCASYFPRFSEAEHGQLKEEEDWSAVEGHFRALNPWPGARWRGKKIKNLEELRRLFSKR